jgi:hypothetical protein
MSAMKNERAKSPAFALALVIAVAPVACSDNKAELSAPVVAEAGAPTVEPTSAFARDVATPLSGECGSCHGARAEKGLVLSGVDEKTLKASLVGVASKEAATMHLIEPGEPDKSYLVLKIRGTLGAVACASSCGAKMPLSGSFPAENMAALESWIKDGAQ